MIHTYIPYTPKTKGNNLGWAYNTFMEIVPDGDWACFLDHDACFTTRYWYYQLEEILKSKTEFGLFTCNTNRIGCGYQRLQGIDYNNHDISYHRKVGKKIEEERYGQVLDITYQPPLSGVLILISKKTWKEVNGFKDGFLGVDNDIHKRCSKAGIKVGLMTGIYLYHWYRGDGDISHLKNNF